MASAWPWYSACEMQLVVALSVQSSVGVLRLQRKISQLIQPIGGVRARLFRATAAAAVAASTRNFIAGASGCSAVSPDDGVRSPDMLRRARRMTGERKCACAQRLRSVFTARAHCAAQTSSSHESQ